MCGRYVVTNAVSKTKGMVKAAINVKDNENYNKDGPVRYGGGGASYKPGCLGKTYIVDKGNSRIPAALKLGYTHIEGIIDEGNTFTL